MGRRALVLLVALLLAGVAAFAVYSYIDGIRAEVEEGQQQVTVYRTSQAVPEGADGSVFLASQPPIWVEASEELEDLPEGAIASEEELRAIIDGKIAVGPISANQILTTNQWIEVTIDVTPLAELIPSGKQALTISTDAVTGVNGFVQPGDRINAIVTIDIEFRFLPENAPDFGVPSGGGGGTGEDGTPEEEEQLSEVVTVSRYVLQGLPVLAVGREIRTVEGDRVEVEAPVADPALAGDVAASAPEEVVITTYTLEVDPEQAEKLVYAFENGSVWLTLVPEDFVEVETDGISIGTLFEGDLVEDIFGN